MINTVVDEVLAHSLTKLLIESRIGFIRREFVISDGSDLIFGKNFIRLIGEGVIGVEGDGDVSSGRETKNFLPTRMSVHPLGDIIYLVVDRHPAVVFEIMLRHFLPSELLDGGRGVLRILLTVSDRGGGLRERSHVRARVSEDLRQELSDVGANDGRGEGDPLRGAAPRQQGR